MGCNLGVRQGAGGRLADPADLAAEVAAEVATGGAGQGSRSGALSAPGEPTMMGCKWGATQGVAGKPAHPADLAAEAATADWTRHPIGRPGQEAAARKGVVFGTSIRRGRMRVAHTLHAAAAAPDWQANAIGVQRSVRASQSVLLMGRLLCKRCRGPG